MVQSIAVRTGFGGALMATALVTGACSSSLTAPSPSVSPGSATIGVMLTVRVLERTSETPIPGALVSYNGHDTLTDAAGQAIVPVKAGEETAIAVSAQAYESMGASGILSNSERWTFYLARQTAQ
jgi:hypothetical protein